MNESQVPLEHWAALHEAMARIKEMKPWEWMNESEIFGVLDPESDLIGFVSIMGMLGEHTAISVYLGPEGLEGFLEMSEEDPEGVATLLFEVPQLQAAFMDRDDLTAQDRNLLKSLGLRYRGKGAWPWCRSFRPGYMPYYLELGEVRFLDHALRQVPEMAERLLESPDAFSSPDEPDAYLVRVPTKTEGGLAWHDEWRVVESPGRVLPEVVVGQGIMATLKGLPRTQAWIEVDMAPLPFGVGPASTRPQLPYQLMLVDGESGLILGTDMLVAEPTLESIWARVPSTLASILLGVGALPQRIDVASDLLYDLLSPLAKDLGLALEYQDELPALDEVMEALSQFMFR